MRIGLEIADEKAVGAVGRGLELDRRIGRGAVDGAADELRRAVVDEGQFLPHGLAVGAGRDALDRQAGIGLEPKSVGDEVEEKRVAGLRFERKPVAISARVEAAGERDGEGDALRRSRQVIRLDFSDRSGRGEERRGERLCGTGNVAKEIDEIGRGIAWREQPPGVAHGRTAGGIASADVDRDLLEPRRPFLGGERR